MKNKYIIICMIIMLGAIMTACSPQALQTLGSSKYYVKVQGEGETYTNNDITRYKYELTGFNKDGESEDLSFTANHQLLEGAYLKIYFKKDEVITYEEVDDEDIPDEALRGLASDDS